MYWTLPNIPRGTRAVGKGGGHREVPSPSQTPSLLVPQGSKAPAPGTTERARVLDSNPNSASPLLCDLRQDTASL